MTATIKTKNSFEVLAEPKPEFQKNTFLFGKYSGRLVKEVFEEDPAYCQWLVDNLDCSKSKHKTYVINSIEYYMKQQK